MSRDELYYRDSNGVNVHVTRDGKIIGVVVDHQDAVTYQSAVNNRIDSKMAVIAAWQAVHDFDSARTRRGFTLEETARQASLRNAALECEGVYERALAREKEAGDRVLKVVLHG